eukprot:sb/3469150/
MNVKMGMLGVIPIQTATTNRDTTIGGKGGPLTPFAAIGHHFVAQHHTSRVLQIWLRYPTSHYSRFITGPAAFACECNIGYTGNGTACGVDSDGDGFPDNALNCNGPTCLVDNCPHLPNSDQADIDNDSIGDECDSDIDADLLVNYRDPCPYDDTTINSTNNGDKDSDGYPNICDNCPNAKGIDSDGDGIDDECDNCVDVANTAQRDTDGDGIGDRLVEYNYISLVAYAETHYLRAQV